MKSAWILTTLLASLLALGCGFAQETVETTTVSETNETIEVADEAVTPAERNEHTMSTFFTELAPYGSWKEYPEYGFVWRPNVSEADWRPYAHNGHWTLTDQGWYFESSLPWAWATFHYGRWTRLDGRWAWVPGTEWAPAWVSWRESNDGLSVGWAALSPRVHCHRRGDVIEFDAGAELTATDFCFVASANLCSADVGVVRYNRARVEASFTKSIAVRNSYSIRGNLIVHHGIEPRHVEHRTGRPIQRVHVPEHSHRVAKYKRHTHGTVGNGTGKSGHATGTGTHSGSDTSHPSHLSHLTQR